MTNFDFMQTPPELSSSAELIPSKPELTAFIESLYNLIEKQRSELTNQRALLRRMSAELMLEGRWKPLEQANEILGFTHSGYAVCLYNFAPGSNLTDEETKAVFDLKLRISDCFESVFARFCHCCSCEGDNSLGAVLLNFPHDDVSDHDLLDMLHHAVTNVREQLGVVVTASLSARRKDIRELPEAKEEVLALLLLQSRLPGISPALCSSALKLYDSASPDPKSLDTLARNHNIEGINRLLCENFLDELKSCGIHTAALGLIEKLEDIKNALGLGKQYESLSISSGEKLRKAKYPGDAITVIIDFLEALKPALGSQLPHSDKSDRDLSDQIRRIIDISFARPDICLSFIASELNTTENRITKSFKNAFGIGVLNYIHHLRIQRSKDLLLSTKYPITKIYSLSGYTNRRTFDRVFKQYTGMTASQFRSCGTSLS
ncbi:MAG: helix-turn-helix transcriptional regulator [Ruminococcaceae bacterium]|nr:helix-turn-helix transcriptional regulator [Oscillospiraceae bacterium]